MGKVGIIAVALCAVASYRLYSCINSFISDVEIDLTLPVADEYWGPRGEEKEEDDRSIKPFEISVGAGVLTSLKNKLKEEISSGRTAPPLDGIGFEYGFNSEYLSQVTEYWLNKYDWKGRERLLNQYPQFKTKISGLNIHFQHVKSLNSSSSSSGKYKRTRPLLVLHGWPGSFVEHQKLIPLLTDPEDSDINFEVVVPSLPGFGFSDGAARPGLGPVEMGPIFVELMRRLGHDKFYVQGGDWGSIIGVFMAMYFPDRVVGLHSNLCLSFHPRASLRVVGASIFPSLFLSPLEKEWFLPLSEIVTFWTRETGYLHLQATKPDTIGAGLSHSPTGLAAYILEKFSTWTDPRNLDNKDGALTEKLGLDELLDNIMVYWVTNSITTSVRIYSEYFGKRHWSKGLERVPINVPTGCIVPRNERYLFQTESMVKDTFRSILSYNYAQDGGHFFGMEQPDVLAKDVIPFVEKVERIYKPF